MKLNNIHHVAIICSNYEISKAFYVDLLGLTVIKETYRDARKSYKLDLQIGNSQIELFSFDDPPARLSYPEAAGLRHLAFEVADLTENLADLDDKAIPYEPVRTDPLTGKRLTFFQDPDGLPIELYEA